MPEAATPAPSRRAVAAAVAVAAVGALAGLGATGEVRIDGARGDWRAATEGLYRSHQPGTLGAGRRAVVHFHGLDGRPGVLVLGVAARPASPRVELSLTAAGAPPLDVSAGVEPVQVEVPVRAGTRDLDVRIESTALFRVTGIELRRPRRWPAPLAPLVGAVAGLAVFALALRSAPPVVALSWGTAGGLAAAAAWMVGIDGGTVVRFAPATRLAFRLAAVALVWIAAMRLAPRRGVAAAAVAATVVIVHGPSLGYGFHQDDFALARGWSWKEVAHTFRGEFDPSGMIPAYYRPIVRLAWDLDHALWGTRTAGYHATNLLLHALAGTLLAALLRRCGLPRAAALLGAVVWVAHPLAASVATWVSARGDSLAAVFYFATLLVFARARPGARSPALTVAFALLAFAAKEMAATLPLAALLLHRVLLPDEERDARRPALRLLILVTAGYLAAWLALMAGKVMVRAGAGMEWARFDPAQLRDWLHLLPGLYLPVFLPPPYEDWWRTPTAGWPLAYRLLALLVPLLAWALARRGSAVVRGATTVGVSWPLATVPPLLALSSTLDLYRLGYLVVVAVAFVAGALAASLERWPAARAALAAALAALVVPLSIDAARAWAPDGFRGRASLHWKVAEPLWVGQLTPEMQGLFKETVARHCHATRWAHPDDACP